jgi:histidine kinase/DNA gyrase B/HSP90-like ATPase
MIRTAAGLLSELVLVRLHGRAAEYLAADGAARPAIISACRQEATVGDLPERILSRTIYAQASSRSGPIRELIQNALDASARGARIDVRSAGAGAGGEGDVEISFSDGGHGMSGTELLEDLLVPFRTRKEGDPDSIGEHGIGFLGALEIAPRLEVTTSTRTEAHRLRIRPVGPRPPHLDFAWTLAPLDLPPGGATGTTVRLTLERPVDRASLTAEIRSVAGLVDPTRARIHVNGVLVNEARARLRRVASAPIGDDGTLGSLELYAGRGDGIPPRLLVTQRGLLVSDRADAFPGAERSLHRELARAIAAAGYGLVADLPPTVPLNKGRSSAAGFAAQKVEDALALAFERFVLEDALHDRELLRGVDHRLASVLDRLVLAAFAGEMRPPPSSPQAAPPALGANGNSPDSSPATPRKPTVAAPEAIVRFADALLDAPMFATTTFDAQSREQHALRPLRGVIEAYRAGLLRAPGEGRLPGFVYLTATDPLSQALLRRLGTLAPPAPTCPRPESPLRMRCVGRERLAAGPALSGLEAMVAAIDLLTQIDAAISASAGLIPSPITVHQDLYGPDEMAHTDGAAISVNVASPRVRALLVAVLGAGDLVALGALVDLLLHEKAHVSLASAHPPSIAEHGLSFYRRKDALRRLLLQAITAGAVVDPVVHLPQIRRDLLVAALPAPELLARAFPTES